MTRLSLRAWWLLIVVAACAAMAAANRAAPVSGFRVVAEFPHDREAFTQGLAIQAGTLYEGTGLEGESSLRKVDLKTGRVQAQQKLDRQYFGEGIAILDGQIFQLTWRNKLAVVYDLETLRFIKTLRYAGEGWGLTTDGKHLIMSDGSSTLRILNPKTFEVVHRLEVKAGRKAVDKLNELEYVDGEIWANIWHSDRIARISPQTGEVLGWIDLTALYPMAQRANRECVLNGIAYDPEKKRIFVTGKNWPKLYEIEITPAKGK